MKISDFVGKLNGGLARTNRYAVNFEPPKTVSVAGLLPMQTLMLFCDKVQLPSISLNTTPIRTYGEVRETPYELNYDTINLSFYVDSQMLVKSFFDDWIKSTQIGDTRSFNYYNDFICPQMQITVQDTLDQSWYMVQLYEVYPKAVGSVDLDYSSQDIMRLNVTLMYKYWKSTKQVVDKGTSKNPLNDPQLPFGLPGLPSSALQIPKFF